MAPPGFHFRDWRREMEQAIARGEAIPIRVLLDQAEQAFEDLQADANELAGLYDGDRDEPPTAGGGPA